MGGGTNQNGAVKATTAAEAAEYPFFGVFGQYTRDNDPWQLYDANNAPPTRQYLDYFYNQTIAYLNSGGVSVSPHADLDALLGCGAAELVVWTCRHGPASSQSKRSHLC